MWLLQVMATRTSQLAKIDSGCTTAALNGSHRSQVFFFSQTQTVSNLLGCDITVMPELRIYSEVPLRSMRLTPRKAQCQIPR